jgi:chemotaxis signal transduction protein
MTSHNVSWQGSGGYGGGQAEDYLLIAIAEVAWAIPAALISEVFYLDNLTPMPLMPVCIEGLTNLRGEVVPVMNLAAVVGDRLLSRRQRDRRCVLLKDADIKLGLVADEVHRIRSVPASQRVAHASAVSHFRIETSTQTAEVLDFDLLTDLIRTEVRRELKGRGLLPGHDG